MAWPTIVDVVSREVVEQLFAVGNESQSLKENGPGSLNDRAFCGKLARAAMAMGNRRDGISGFAI